MEEMEPPTEQVQEDIHHHAHESGLPWIMGVALSSAIIAALAAVCAMLSGHHANEAMMEQVQAVDQWAYYQAKGIEKSDVERHAELMAALGKPIAEKDLEKSLKKYEGKKEEASKSAREKEEAAKDHMQRHKILSYGVTLFQIAITIAAISVLTKKSRFWFVALAFAAVGVFFLAQGILFPNLFGGPAAAHG